MIKIHPGPAWTTNEVKIDIKINARVHRKWVLRGRISEESGNIRCVQNETNRIIRNAKNHYFLNLGETLPTYRTRSNSFWTTLKRLVNKKITTNITSDFRQKCNIFNEYFANQCSLNHISSTLHLLRMRTDSNLFLYQYI